MDFKDHKYYLKLVIFFGSSLLISYLLVYHAAFMPLGYNVDSEPNVEMMTVISYNFLGSIKETFLFSEINNEIWMLIELSTAIENQKQLFVLVFFAFFVSIQLTISNIKKGQKPSRVIPTMVVGFLGSMVGLYTTVERIKILLELIQQV